MKFIAIKTDDGQIKGEISFYCHMLKDLLGETLQDMLESEMDEL